VNEWQTFLLTLSAAGSVVAAVLSWTVKLRWSEEERRNKDAQIAQVKETVKAKEAHIAGFQERLKEKDDHIDNLKTLSATNVLANLEAQKTLHERQITNMEVELTKAQESHSRSEQEITDLREQLALAQASLNAMSLASTALRSEFHIVGSATGYAAATGRSTGIASYAMPPPLPLWVQGDIGGAAGNDNPGHVLEPTDEDSPS
jgi:hypothetical protein